MDLEKRVEQLEQELEILKNQIQTTLLAIQEHVLSNTYPALRAPERGMGSAPAEVVPSHTEEPTPPPPSPRKQIKLASDITPEDDADDTPEVKPAAIVKRVENRSAKSAPSTPEPDLEPEPESSPKPQRVPDPPKARVAQAARDEIGSDRPTQPKASAIRISAKTPVPQPTKKQESREAATLPDWTRLARLEDWFNHQVAKNGLQRTRELIEAERKSGEISPEDHNILLQFLSIREQYTEAEPQNSSNVESVEDTSSDALTRSLVLKLAAGIQNAGTSTVRWQKKHGQGNNNGASHRD